MAGKNKKIQEAKLIRNDSKAAKHLLRGINASKADLNSPLTIRKGKKTYILIEAKTEAALKRPLITRFLVGYPKKSF